MSLFVIAEMRAVPGQEKRLRDAVEAMVEPSLAEPGCVSYRPFVDTSDPAHVVIVEEWTDGEVLDEHFRTPHFEQVAKVLDEILAEPLVIRRLVAE
ncbi:antibiotic biosynthesis monooxygenase [Nocardia sp. CDC159]|uniref:Antibiotic biosynthesis monooxygenase n=1 Tax=Nocardia pulmonis TaxID=2951408 RepID=A0A9X2E410_9NOCA|nr:MULTISPECIES: putative quinol monooxygenase [Nocardia]MCM6773240.1 antibiotic biosynthesis monooxygenase [Nocardia pulmonis]MCM6786127.1 antibiotic biosynthesis monooxygenase [Nocardia sp. CDC159]